MDGYYFSGSPSLAVLQFLEQLVTVADQTLFTEATLLWIVADFLRPPARDAFRRQKLRSWPAAVQWFLTTYASEPILEAAMRSLQTSSQTPSETVRQFGDRLQSEALLLGDLFSHGELKSLFTQGLTRSVRSMFAASQPAQELDDLVPLRVLIGRAELVEDGVNQSRPHLSRWSPTYARPSPRSLTPRLPILAKP